MDGMAVKAIETSSGMMMATDRPRSEDIELTDTAIAGSTPPDAHDGPPAFADAAVVGRNGWWRYLLSLIVIVVTTFALQAGLAVVAYALGVPVLDLFGDGDDAASQSMASPAGFALLMLSVAAMLPATLLAVRWVHRRPIGTLFTARPAFAWRACGISAVVPLAAVVVLTAAMAVARPGTVEVVFEPGAFLLFLPLVLALVPLQVAAEEVLFRGYVLQAVARLSRRWWPRLLVPAALFTLAHMWNAEFRAGGLWAAVDYAAVALYLGYLALRGGGLEHAIGFHAGLNTAFFAFVGLSVADFRTPTVVLIADYDFRLGLLGTVLICAAHYGLIMRRS